MKKELRDRPKSARIKLPHPIQVKEGLSLNEQYNTRNAVSSIPNEILRKYGVKRASRKYNKSRSYIYFWKARWDGTIESLAEHSKRPHHHPNEHTPDELKLIKDMRRRNPQLGLTELWHRLHKRGYTRRVESLYRVLKRLALLPQAPEPPPLGAVAPFSRSEALKGAWEG